MFGFLLVLLLLDGVFMTVIVLLQAGKGGGLASVGGGAGTDSLIGGRQAATLLTKATWISGSVFLTLSLVLSILSSRQAEPTDSVLRGLQPDAPAATQPALPGSQPGPLQPVAPAGQTPAPTTGGE